jgi:hypothetical protein
VRDPGADHGRTAWPFEKEREQKAHAQRLGSGVRGAYFLVFSSFLAFRSQMTSEELATVRRDMDAILAAAAAEGQLDEQFGQLLSLQVCCVRIWVAARPSAPRPVPTP